MKWFLYALFGIGIAFGWFKFMQSGDKEAKELRDDLTIHFSGPWAPHSFIELELVA